MRTLLNIPVFEDIWDKTVWSIGGLPITVGRLVVSVAVVALGVYLSLWLCRWAAKWLTARGRLTPTGISALTRLAFYFLVVTWFMFGLDVLHIPLTTFTFLGGAFALAIGFGAKDIIGNFISGFILMAERPLRIGDIVEVDGQVGEVQSIGIRSTLILTDEDIHVVIPNTTLLSTTLINWTLTDNIVLSCVTLGIGYDADQEKAAQLMRDTVLKVTGVLAAPAPRVLFWDFGDSNVIYRVYFASAVTSQMERWEAQSRVRAALFAALTAAKVDMCFPQRSVHLDTSIPLEVRVREDGAGK